MRVALHYPLRTVRGLSAALVSFCALVLLRWLSPGLQRGRSFTSVEI